MISDDLTERAEWGKDEGMKGRATHSFSDRRQTCRHKNNTRMIYIEGWERERGKRQPCHGDGSIDGDDMWVNRSNEVGPHLPGIIMIIYYTRGPAVTSLTDSFHAPQWRSTNRNSKSHVRRVGTAFYQHSSWRSSIVEHSPSPKSLNVIMTHRRAITWHRAIWRHKTKPLSRRGIVTCHWCI